MTTTRLRIGWIDLNGDGRAEALVYVSGKGWCGTGGCRLLVLEQDGDTFKVRAVTHAIRPPVAVLRHRSHGWRDITVRVGGGGILKGYTGVLPFDVSLYPRNSSTPPAQRLSAAVEEEVIIPDDTYPYL